MTLRGFVIFGNALILGLITAARSDAAVNVSLLPLESFPSNADFQTFNPFDPATPTAAERTVREDATLPDGTRHITQTFQLDSAITISEIDFLFVRGASGNTGILRIFDVANTLAGNITADYDDALANGFLLDVQFTMPPGLDPASNVEQTLKLSLTGPDAITLGAMDGPAGYAISLSSVVDGNTAVNNEVFTWRFGDPGTGSGTGWYADGRVYYDDFVSSGSTETRRDGLFALIGEPPIPGDTNGNGIGGEFPQDFDPIRDNFRMIVSSRAMGDLTGDGRVDLADFKEWKAVFLAAGGSLVDVKLGLAADVPEPSSLALALLVIAAGTAYMTVRHRYSA